MPLALRERDDGVEIAVRVIPRSGRNALDGLTETGALRVRLSAPPVEGAANAALIAFLADRCDLPKRAVRITSGEHGRDKRVAIAAPRATVEARLRTVSVDDAS